jgi:DNA-binding NarL/FixJ family response regulator
MEATAAAANTSAPQADSTQGHRGVRILIADSTPAFCESLRRVLTPRHRLTIVGEAYDAARVCELTAIHRPQMRVLDYDLSRSMEMQDEPAADQQPFDVLTLHAPEKESIIESFRLGARGIILKNSPARVWRRGIAAVISGQYWLGNESLAVLIQAIREPSVNGSNSVPSRHFGLTAREIEIVQKIADGRSNKQVGEDCSIRERTVKHHLTNIFSKVGVSSRLELAVFARNNRIFNEQALLTRVRDHDNERVRRMRPQGATVPDGDAPGGDQKGVA